MIDGWRWDKARGLVRLFHGGRDFWILSESAILANGWLDGEVRAGRISREMAEFIRDYRSMPVLTEGEDAELGEPK